MKNLWMAISIAVSTLVGGCASAQRPVAAAASQPQQPPLTQEQAAAVDNAQAETSGLQFEESILQMCPGIRPAQFDFDSARVKAQFRDALVAFAECMQHGALQGKEVLLVGRADPRGSEDYNLALGGSRAGAVRSAVESLGVQERFVDITSRGALDARGTDESGWAEDRRVDVKLETHPSATVSTLP
jgi:peptidoglycan-associated lipoprotein